MSGEQSDAESVEFQVLGPLELRVDGQVVNLGGPHTRAIVGLGLVNRNRVVSVDTLIEEIWGGDPPRSAVSSIQVAVSSLRRVLPTTSASGSVLQTRSPGYRLAVDDSSVDLAAFTQRRDHGAAELRAGRYEGASTELGDALGLWKGLPLEDLQRFRFASDFATALEEERLFCVEMKLDADLRCGRQEAALADLLDLTARFPLRERLWAQLATTQYQLGRQADALATLQQLRSVLDDELGIEPSPALRQLEVDILRQEVDPARPSPTLDLGATVGEPVGGVVAELVSSTGEVFLLSERTRLGRAPDSDIVLTDERASRHHAFIYSTPDGLMVSDLRSRNGTLLNGRLLVEDHRFVDGDVLTVGRISLTLRS